MPGGGYWRRDVGNHPLLEGRHPDSPDSYGLARRFGRGAVSPRKLDSGLRRNDGAGMTALGCPIRIAPLRRNRVAP